MVDRLFFHSAILISLLALGIVESGAVFVVVFFIYCFSLVFFMKRREFPKKINNNFPFYGISSPVNGKVLYIQRHVSHDFFENKVTKICIAVSWWRNGTGVYLPDRCKIEDMELREAINGSFVALLNEAKKKMGLEFFGRSLKLMIMPGDKGRSGSRIGYFPWGGAVLMYLPEEYEILIEEGGRVVAGGLMAKNWEE